jgi:benzylsuccinate CoA-transferase BbsF subunit
MAARDDRDWLALASAIGGSELASDALYATLGLRQQAEDEIEKLIADWTAQRTPHEVQALLQAHGVPAHVASASADMVSDPQLMARQHFVRLEHPLMGTSPVETSRYRLSDTPGVPVRAAPTFGRDNLLILRDILGYDEARIAALESAGVLV